MRIKITLISILLGACFFIYGEDKKNSPDVFSALKKEGENGETFKSLVKKAEAGDVSAMETLGTYYFEYYKGYRTTRLNNAEKWYKMAMEKDYNNARVWKQLNKIDAKKEHKVIDISEIAQPVEQYLNSYHAGNLNALIDLGDLLIEKAPSCDVELMQKTAGKCFQKAAERGYSDGYLKLGYIYDIDKCFGDCGIKNTETAMKYYEKAAEMGNDQAIMKLVCYYYRKKDYEKYLELVLTAAEKGNRDAFFYLGRFYSREENPVRDLKKAFEYYQKAFAVPPRPDRKFDEVHNAQLAKILADCYLYGQGCEKDYKKAFICLNIALNNSCWDACYTLGYMKENGLGVEKNINEAIGYYDYGARTLDKKSRMKMARYYFEGIHVNKDWKKAEKYFILEMAKYTTATYNPLAAAYLVKIRKTKDKQDKKSKKGKWEEWQEQKEQNEIDRNIGRASRENFESDKEEKIESREDEAIKLIRMALREKFEDMEEAVNIILDAYPDNLLALYRKAELLYEKGKKKEALAQFEDIIEKVPADILTQIYIDTIKKELSGVPAKTGLCETLEKSTKKPRVSVLNLNRGDVLAAKFTGILSDMLMKQEWLEVLEREAIDKLLEEHERELQNREVLKLNEIIRSELMFIFSDEVDKMGRKFIKMGVLDNRYGIRILEAYFPCNIDVFMSQIGIPATKALALYTGKKLPPVFSIAPLVRDGTLDVKYREYQDILASMLRYELLRRGACVLEFEEARRVFDEIALSKGNERTEQMDVFIFSGNISLVKKDGKEGVALELSSYPSATSRDIHVYKGYVALDKGLPSQADIGNFADKIMKTDEIGDGVISRKDGFDKLFDAASKHIKMEDFISARKELEAALFFDPSSLKIRKLLAEAYYGWIAKEKQKMRIQGYNGNFQVNYEYFTRYIQNMEWLVRRQEISDPKYLDSVLWCPNNFFSSSEKYRKIWNGLALLCENVLQNGTFPLDVQDKAMALYIKCSGVMDARDFNERISTKKQIVNLILRCGDKLLSNQTPFFLGIFKDRNYAELLELVLKEENLSPLLRSMAQKELKYIGEYSKLETDKPLKSFFKENPEYLKKLEEDASSEILNKSVETLLDDANRAFKENDYNNARLNFEAALQKNESLDIDNEVRLAKCYAIILQSFPYSYDATDNEREIAIKFSERGIVSLKRILPMIDDPKVERRDVYMISPLAYLKKVLDLGVDFDAKVTEAQKGKITQLMKEVRTIYEKFTFNDGRNCTDIKVNFVLAMENQYKDTYFWLEKDDESRISHFKEFHLKKVEVMSRYDVKRKGILCQIPNIYLYKKPDIALSLYRFLKEYSQFKNPDWLCDELEGYLEMREMIDKINASL